MTPRTAKHLPHTGKGWSVTECAGTAHNLVDDAKSRLVATGAPLRESIHEITRRTGDDDESLRASVGSNVGKDTYVTTSSNLSYEKACEVG